MLTPEQRDWYENMKVGASFRAPYFRRAIAKVSALPYPGLGTFAIGSNGIVYIDFDWAMEGGMEKSTAMLIHVVSHLTLDHARRARAITGDPAHQGTAHVAEDMEINQGLVHRPYGGTRVDWRRSILKDDYMAIYPWSEGFNLEPDRPMEHYLRLLLKKRDGGGNNRNAELQPQDAHQHPHQDSSRQRDDFQQGSTQSCQTGSLQQGMGAVLAGLRGSGPEEGPNGRFSQTPPPTLCGGGSGLGHPVEGELFGDGEGLDETEIEHLRRDVARDIIEHEKSNGRGSVPDQLLRMAEEVLRGSKIDWRREIRVAVARSVRVVGGQTRYNAKKHNRRMANVSNFIFPGTESPTPNISVAIDTSGSMGREELGLALGQIDSILRQAGAKARIDFVAVDARATTPRRLKSLSDVRLVGGGGTDMRVAISSFDDRRRNRPDLGIIVTDGITPWPDEKPQDMAIVIAIVGQGSTDDEYTRNGGWPTPDWAKTVYISRIG